MSKWQPWEDYKDLLLPDLPITKPPCEDCLMWSPQPKYMNLRGGLCFDGVICCHSEIMHGDFSCFRDKESILAKIAND